MSGIATRPPSWLKLECVLPLEAGECVTPLVTSLTADASAREYGNYVVQLFRCRRGMKLKHALRHRLRSRSSHRGPINP